MTPFNHLSLSRQFLYASFPVVLAGALVIGWWVGDRIERGVTSRLGAVTSLYVDSFVAPHLQDLSPGQPLATRRQAALDGLLTDTPLGQKIVAFKIWDSTGRVLYSTNTSLIGRTFPIDDGLAGALKGNVRSTISDLSLAENELEAPLWPRLIETYSPIHADASGTVIAAAEFYQTTEELDRETRAAHLRSWLVVVGTMLTMYLLIFGLVRRGSETITAQSQQLNQKVDKLSALLDQNARLHGELRGAALRTTALTESFLRRIATDLHDGPAQDMALALMRCESMLNAGGHDASRTNAECCSAVELASIRIAMRSALGDLRAICKGLHVPDIEGLDAVQIAGRAVHEFESKTGASVHLTSWCAPSVALPVPIKIALYRVIQEGLANAFRHGHAATISLDMACASDVLDISIVDDGVGFHPTSAASEGHLGLAGMRERLAVLAGSLDIQSSPGRGTTLHAALPTRLAAFTP